MQTNNSVRIALAAGMALLAIGLIAGLRLAPAQPTGIPTWLNYQGRLTTHEGEAVPDGAYQATFKVFDSGTGGSLLWTEQGSVAVQEGIFSTTLGKKTPFPSDLFYQRLWLEVEIDGLKLLPRQELGAIAFAFTSSTALSLPPDTVTTEMLQDSSVTGQKLADLSVSEQKLGAGSVTESKIGSNAVSAEKVADGAVQTSKVQDSAVTAAKLASDQNSLAKVSGGTIVNTGGSIRANNLIRSVSGGGAGTGMSFESTGPVNPGFGVYAGAGSPIAGQLRFGDGSGWRFEIVRSQGNTLAWFGDNGSFRVFGPITATEFITSSTRRYKDDIRPIPNALDIVMNLQGVSYRSRLGARKQEIGLVAEQVQSVLPQVVAFDESGNPDGIDYARLVAVLVEALKEQQAQINYLQRTLLEMARTSEGDVQFAWRLSAHRRGYGTTRMQQPW